MKPQEKKDHLLQLDETDFRRNLVVPLFRNIRTVNTVSDVHGSNERGIDVVYFQQDPVAPQPICVGTQLKKGDITTTSGRGKEGVTKLEEQISLAASNELRLANPVGVYRISRLQIMTTGNITDGARRHLAEYAQSRYRLPLQFLDGGNVIELVDKHFPDYWQYVDKSALEYYSELKRRYGEMEDISKLGANRKLAIEEIYVPMKVIEVVDEDSLDFHETKDEQVLEINPPDAIDEVNLLDGDRRVLLVGDTGSGKRVVLRHLLFEQLRRNEEASDGGVIPFLLDARELAKAKDLWSFLNDYLKHCGGGQLIPELEERLTNQGGLLLVDKLSRVRSDEDIRRVLDLCTEFTDQYKEVRSILALRESQLTGTISHLQFKRFQLIQFGTAQVAMLVRNWYSNSGPSTDMAPELAIQQLLRNVSQGSLPRTPLVYTLNLVLIDSEEAKTSNIADLFDKYADLFLGKWNQELGIRHQFEFRLKKRLLSELALFMTDQGVESLHLDEVIVFFRQVLDHAGLAGDPKALLDELRMGGIIVQEGRQVRFAIYVLQEFFAGVAMQLKEDVSEEQIVSKLDERLWGMPLIFYAGLKRECNHLLESIITEKETSDFAVQGHRSYMAGMIASNADQSESILKREAIRFALLGYVMTLKKLAVVLRDRYGQVGDLYAGLFIDTMAFYGLGSPMLERQYKSLLEDGQSILESFDVDGATLTPTEEEIPRFLLSSILLRFGLDGYEEALREVLSTPDPYILSLLNIRLAQFLKRKRELEESQPDPIRNWRPVTGIQTKLKSKLRQPKYREARRHLFRKNRNQTKKGFLEPPPEKVLARPSDYLEFDLESGNADRDTTS